MIGYYSHVVYKEEKKPIPDLEKITQWENEKRTVHALFKGIAAANQVAIADINATYWPVLRAFIAKEKSESETHASSTKQNTTGSNPHDA